jgi:hypothetical protein
MRIPSAQYVPGKQLYIEATSRGGMSHGQMDTSGDKRCVLETAGYPAWLALCLCRM